MIKRVNTSRGYHYIDTDTEQRIPGVTGIIDGGIPKKALIAWAGNATAEYAIDHWDALSGLAPSARLKKLQGSRYETKDAAANRGTKVHALGADLVHGKQVTVADELIGHVESYLRFLDDFDVTPLHVERVVYSVTHNYCGTLDLIADLVDPDDPPRRVRWLLDLKTSRSGVFGETALQLAGYRYADVWFDDDDTAHDMPEVDRCGAVHIRADGYSLIPLEVEEQQLRQLLYAQQIAQFVAGANELVGAPISSSHQSTYRLVQDGDPR